MGAFAESSRQSFWQCKMVFKMEINKLNLSVILRLFSNLSIRAVFDLFLIRVIRLAARGKVTLMNEPRRYRARTGITRVGRTQVWR